MSDPADRRRQRAAQIRARYAESESAREARIRTRDALVSVALVGMGALVVLGSSVNRLWWGVPGGLLVAAAAVPLRWRDRRARGTVLALAMFLGGLVLTMAPWSW